jgi:hypothetical protein
MAAAEAMRDAAHRTYQAHGGGVIASPNFRMPSEIG